uniref:Uncharacterized protein n=1 Tax=Steinernema glaseri TaxID=37863 RepID=A0A1I7Y0L0_9BILA
MALVINGRGPGSHRVNLDHTVKRRSWETDPPRELGTLISIIYDLHYTLQASIHLGPSQYHCFLGKGRSSFAVSSRSPPASRS